MKARSRAKSVEVVLSQLSSGYGAQRLPSALRAIEIQDVPSRGLWKGQRAFLKDILPKIKYHNTHLEITTEWKRGPERKKRSSKETSQAENSSEAASPSAERASPLIRLRFGELRKTNNTTAERSFLRKCLVAQMICPLRSCSWETNHVSDQRP